MASYFVWNMLGVHDLNNSKTLLELRNTIVVCITSNSWESHNMLNPTHQYNSPYDDALSVHFPLG